MSIKENQFNEITAQRDNSRGIVESVRKAGKIKSVYSIVCQYDDPAIAEKKVAIRDNKLENFNENFQHALELSPDRISIKVYQGEGNSAFEVVDSENVIRISKVPKIKTATASRSKSLGKVDVDHEFALQNARFQAEMREKHQELATAQLMSEKNGVISILTNTITDLEKNKVEVKSYVDELEKENEDLKLKGGIKVDTIVNAGLAGLAAFAAKNPTGSLFGVIPNQALAGFFGKPNQLEASADANPRTSYYDQIIAYCNTLTDAEFEQVYSVFAFMGEKKNIALLFSLIQKETNKASS